MTRSQVGRIVDPFEIEFALASGATVEIAITRKAKASSGYVRIYEPFGSGFRTYVAEKNDGLDDIRTGYYGDARQAARGATYLHDLARFYAGAVTIIPAATTEVV